MISFDFNVRDENRNVVAKVVEKLFRPTSTWEISYFDASKTPQIATLTFPMLRDLAKLKFNGKEYQVTGEFVDGKYDLIDENNVVCMSSSRLESSTNSPVICFL